MQYSCEGKTQAIYIHWPFCPYRCKYCPFVALAGHEGYMGVYNDALNEEIRAFGKSYSADTLVKTVYLGGGTPSTWPSEYMLDTFATLNNVFRFDTNAEITLEVNPGTVTQEKVMAWRACGINRLSVGVQSLDDQVLHQMGRYHTVADVKKFFDYTAGIIENISIDLIIGLPGVSRDAWRAQLETVATWPIQHISLYFLTVHEHTRLYADLQRGDYALPCEDEAIDTYEETVSMLATKGFRQYEVSNFARVGGESRHNKAYWSRVAYKGFGLGASSFDGVRRLTTTANLMTYMDGVQQHRDVTAQSEYLTEDQIRLETIMLGLRQAEGVSRDYFFEGRSKEEIEKITTELDVFIHEGLLFEQHGRICATVRGFMLENHLVSKLTV